MIEVKNLTKKYGDFTALENLSVKIEPGSIYGLVGYNGAGKTTLLKTMMGIYRADGGKVLLEGEDIFDNEVMKRCMFLIPDETFILPQADMQHMAAFYQGFYPNWKMSTFKRLTEIFKLDPKKRIAGFSKGMQRQASIILALSTHTRYLLVDELFDGLDPVIRNLSRQLMLEMIAGSDTTVVVSSHNLRELEDLCDHIGVINNKHIVFDSSIEAMRSGKRQYRVVLPSDIKEDAFAGIPHSAIHIHGQIATFTSRGDEARIDHELAMLSPILVEKLPMTLEEIFLDEMEVGEYDFSGIFGQA